MNADLTKKGLRLGDEPELGQEGLGLNADLTKKGLRQASARFVLDWPLSGLNADLTKKGLRPTAAGPGPTTRAV